jgi:hypothetical protein
MIFLAISSRFFPVLLHHKNLNTDGAQNLFSMAHNIVPTEDGPIRHLPDQVPESGPIFVITSTSSNV